jgi:hypothetical protein
MLFIDGKILRIAFGIYLAGANENKFLKTFFIRPFEQIESAFDVTGEYPLCLRVIPGHVSAEVNNRVLVPEIRFKEDGILQRTLYKRETFPVLSGVF